MIQENNDTPRAANDSFSAAPVFQMTPGAFDTSKEVADYAEDVSLADIALKRANEFWHSGRRNAKQGQRSSAIGGLAASAADFMVDDVRTKLKGLADRRAKEEAAAAAHVREKEQAVENRKTYADWLRRLRQIDPGPFSFTLGLFYLSVGIFLVIADIPIAQVFIEDALDLQFGGIDGWLITIGVALSVVYLKIWFDEYMVRSPIRKYEKTVAEAERNEMMINEEKMWRSTKWRRRGITIIQHAVFILTLLVIFAMAMLREELQVGASLADAGWAMWAFLGLTLLFPVIGGVCFAYGFSYLQNGYAFRKAISERRSAQESLKDAQAAYRAVCQKQQESMARLNQCLNSADEMRDRTRQLFINAYAHGFDEGIIVPAKESPRGLVKRANEIRDRHLSLSISGEPRVSTNGRHKP